jgi:DNA-binding MarR family transcriptional regulator
MKPMNNTDKVLRDLRAGQSELYSIAKRLKLKKSTVERIISHLEKQKKVFSFPYNNLTIWKLKNEQASKPIRKASSGI